jgi:hypothetical protein
VVREVKRYTVLVTADDVTDEIIAIVRQVTNGRYAIGPIDWEDVWDCIEDTKLADGTYFDSGTNLHAPALLYIQHVIRFERSRAPIH